MSEPEFAEIERQLEEILWELKMVRDPQLRRKIMADVGRLLIQADRVLMKNGGSEEPDR